MRHIWRNFPGSYPCICLSVYISASLIYFRVMKMDEVLITKQTNRTAAYYGHDHNPFFTFRWTVL